MPVQANPQQRATHWLSRDLTALPELLKRSRDADRADAIHPPRPDFDVVIIGSGYGASMVLHELAGYGVTADRPLRIAMFERGKEYLPGMFPTRMSDLAGHVRYSTRGQADVRGRESGLFDVRVGPDMGVLVANGLGGGSLINAGVMEAPQAAVWQDSRWPGAIRNDGTLGEQLDQTRQLLRAQPYHPAGARAEAMDRLAGRNSAEAVAITVAQHDDAVRGIKACIACGDCATGCNFRAKLSLDVSVMADALRKHDRNSVFVFSGATVKTFRHLQAGGYELDLIHTDAVLRRRQVGPLQVSTGKLVIAAGTLGSTELLLRASHEGVATARKHIGRRFSGNGDNLSAVYGMAQPALAVADEDTPHASRGIGPTITRMIDRRSEQGAGFIVQDLAIPGPLRRMLQEIVTTGASVDALTHFNRDRYTRCTAPDTAGIDADTIDRTMVVALIGQDDADGRLDWSSGSPGNQPGTLGVAWPAHRTDPRLDTYQAALAGMGAQGHPAALVIANPAWRPLPASIENLFGGVRGPTFTVHPLGGCVMSDNADTGVVNALGQVFASDTGDSVHADLVVLDGSIIPTALGINPGLAIATLARRATRELRDRCWGFVPAAGNKPADPGPRRSFRENRPPKPQASTRIEFNERMLARATVMVDGVPRKCRLEIRLQFEPQEVASLIAARSARVLTLNPDRSVLALLHSPSEADSLPVMPSPAAVEDPDPPPMLEFPLSGQLQLLRMRPSLPTWRTLVALTNWFLNRALRDLFSLWLSAAPGPAPRQRKSVLRWLASLPGMAWSAIKLASHAGNQRQLTYRLMLGAPSAGDPALIAAAGHWSGHCIGVTKTITYQRAGNPVNQFTFAHIAGIEALHGLRINSTLKVDYNYFAQIGIPLIRIASQADQPRALIDLASFALYLTRVVMPLHAWSFRLPDRPRAHRKPHPAPLPGSGTPGRPNANGHRLPGSLPGLPAPDHVLIPFDTDHCHCLLTRYRRQTNCPRSAVLMIHGYSASGTTFAHRLLPDGGLAGTLARAGHDVWVLDMRSSAGMPTAQAPWSFEQMGCQDIALAIERIVTELAKERIVTDTGHAQIDVVAHCMGAAMLSLGLFGSWPPSTPKQPSPDQFPRQRAAMVGRIRRLVLSQVGPAVVMSPTNTARAYVFSWLRHYFRMGGYTFLPDAPSQSDDMLDRLLNLVPYPREDFHRENPFWRPWQRTTWAIPRHRMDALYGVTFNLAGMGDDVLDAIDDFFGPMNLETVAQVIAFARHRLVTDRQGRTDTIVPEEIARIRHCKVLCLHSEENDLTSVSTRRALLQLLGQAQLAGTSLRLQEVGHQDSLIGVQARRTYDHVGEFLR